MTGGGHPALMDVTVAAGSHCLRIVISGELDETAPEIVGAAAAVASAERVPLVVDTSAAYPQRSPILAAVHSALEEHDQPGDQSVSW